MREYIDKNTTVTLLSNGQKQKFTVNDIIGIGGSCIAYNVTYYEDGNIVLPFWMRVLIIAEKIIE